MRTMLWMVFVLGCGSDAAKIADAPVDVRLPADAMVDAPIVAGAAHRYVVDHQKTPLTNNEAVTYGLDLDNDGIVDNSVGKVDAALNSMGFDTQLLTTHAIDTGAVITLLDLAANDLATDATASFTLDSGANAMPLPCAGSSDTTCRHHLAGTGTFDVAAASAHDPVLTGAIAANALTAGPGTLHFPVTIFGALVSVELIGARVKLSSITETAITGIVAGAIPQTEIDTKVIPAIATATNAQIALDCSMLASPPTCGCTTGSTGATLISLFDSTHDCTVSSAEVMSSQLVTAFLAPDVTIGTVHGLSFGVGITAVHGTFTP